MPKTRVALFVDPGLIAQYDQLAASAGTFRSTLMRHALLSGLDPLRAALAAQPTRFALRATPLLNRAAPAAGPPPPNAAVFEGLRRHLSALQEANAGLGADELRRFAEQHLAALPAGRRPAVDAVEQLVVELAALADGDLDPVPGHEPPV